MPSTEVSLSAVHPAVTAPTTAEVDAISIIANPVIRNLKITQCYFELSSAFAARTGMCANWCTFATWASKQAGQTIRGEDLQRTIENKLKQEPAISEILSWIATIAKDLGSQLSFEQIRQTALGGLIKTATSRASDAVARGNKKVFEEIALVFARFIETCFADEQFVEAHINSFCQGLGAGDPPGGQAYLRRAFNRYYQGLFETNARKRDELFLFANLEVGFHEQTRLQPEIAESLNAAMVDVKAVKKHLWSILLKESGLWGKVVLVFSQIIGKKASLHNAINRLILRAERHIRMGITEHLMTLTLPPDNCLSLGKDFTAGFPATLQQLENTELLTFLTKIDPTANSVAETGATDWADLNERLHFIADMFRCFHQSPDLFSEAFTTEQLTVLEKGELPGGRL